MRGTPIEKTNPEVSREVVPGLVLVPLERSWVCIIAFSPPYKKKEIPKWRYLLGIGRIFCTPLYYFLLIMLYSYLREQFVHYILNIGAKFYGVTKNVVCKMAYILVEFASDRESHMSVPSTSERESSSEPSTSKGDASNLDLISSFDKSSVTKQEANF